LVFAFLSSSNGTRVSEAFCSLLAEVRFFENIRCSHPPLKSHLKFRPIIRAPAAGESLGLDFLYFHTYSALRSSLFCFARGFSSALCVRPVIRTASSDLQYPLRMSRDFATDSESLPWGLPLPPPPPQLPPFYFFRSLSIVLFSGRGL